MDPYFDGCGVSTRILLVEDHQVLRDGLRGLIERAADFEVVAEAGDGATAVALSEQLRPDLVVMDIWLPRLSGIDATRQILAKAPETRVLILSQHDSWSTVQQAFEAGAHGYLVKTSSASQLLVAARAIRDGDRYVSPDLRESGLRAAPVADSPLAQLSAREREVLQLIAEGLSNREIAATLGIAERTAGAHRTSVMSKLDVHKATDLVRLAIREGLMAP
jgi:DNA-binding NarL/FixJ family response regulator